MMIQKNFKEWKPLKTENFGNKIAGVILIKENF